MSRRSTYRSLFIIVVILFSQKVIAQAPEKTYYNAGWKKCDVSQACYVSQVLKTDSGYYRTNHYVNNGALQMAALFEDKDCKMQNGLATYYYATGRMAGTDRQIHGKKEGTVVSYYNDGAMYDSSFYRQGKQVGAEFRWHRNGALSDSISESTDSMRVHVMWFDDGLPAGAGREVNGKKTGRWVFYHHNGNPASKEVYEAGKLTSVQQFDETGKEMALDTSRKEQAAMIKGGTAAWHKYLERSLEWPEGYTFATVSQVQLQVEMTIKENGRIDNIYVINPLHPAFDNIVYRVMNKSPQWFPAIQHNRAVPYRLRQSVTFVKPQ